MHQTPGGGDGELNYGEDEHHPSPAYVSPAGKKASRRLSTEVREDVPSQLDADPDYDEKQSPSKPAGGGGGGGRRAQTAGLQRPEMHCGDLWLANLTLLFTLIELLTDAALLREYDGFGSDARNNYWALIALRCIHAFVHILFDYVNRGRFRYFLFDICQLRVIIEWLHYVSDWVQHRNQIWIESEFRSDVTFESFMYSLPSLIVQVHWIITDVRPVTTLQIVAIFATSIQALINLLHVFKYVSVGTTAYFVMCVKAVLNTLLRTILVALLLSALQFWAVIWIIGSFLVGGVIYFCAVRAARSHNRDDPLAHWFCHSLYGTLIALNIMFVSFPFAPTRCVTDWWLGYLISEVKMQLEMIAMFVVAVGLYWGDTERVSDPAQFYIVIGFAFAMALADAVTLVFLHYYAERRLRRRKSYSNDFIIDLFNSVCVHLQRLLLHQRRAVLPHVPAVPAKSQTLAILPASTTGDATERRESRQAFTESALRREAAASDQSQYPPQPQSHALANGNGEPAEWIEPPRVQPVSPPPAGYATPNQPF